VEPGPTPWRALEDPGPNGPEPEGAPPPPGGVPRSALLAGVGAVLLAAVAFVLAFGGGASGSVAVDGAEPLATGASRGASSAALVDGLADPPATALVVEVVGAIDRPGVYRLPAGARVGDLVEAAGGYGPRVDADRAGRELNLAAPLRDGDQVRVPSRDDPSSLAAPAADRPAVVVGGPAVVDPR
jgi:competence protein ComEA